MSVARCGPAHRVAAPASSLRATIPVSSLSIRRREAIGYERPVFPLDDEEGLERALERLVDVRAGDPASDAVYIGLISPAASREAYCERGCTDIVSTSNLGNRPEGRSLVALGFAWEEPSVWRLIGELPPVLGLLPEKLCEPIRAEGYDYRSGRFVPPSHTDLLIGGAPPDV